MSPEERAVCEAAERFYKAIDTMVATGNVQPIADAWHHTPLVTTGHPVSGWVQGWDQVDASWKAFATFAGPDHGPSTVKDLKAFVYGDVAYTTCLFVVAEGFGGETLACTNVLLKKDGVWKIIHHHADKAPAMNAIIDKMIAAG